MRLPLRAFTVVAVLLLCSMRAASAAYPDRPITLVVPYAAGGPMDRLARLLATRLQSSLGQPVVIANQGGAGGNLGVSSAKRSAADGYTLLLDHVHMATAPALYRALGHDPEADFEPLGVVAESPLVLTAKPDVPAASLGDLLRWLARQRDVTLAHAGLGSASHLCGLLLQSALKIRMTTVPYRGTGPAMIDLLSGQVDLMCDLTANVVPQIQAGKLQGIAVTVRTPLTGTPLASTPAMETYGLAMPPLTIWYGLYAPKGTPAAIVEKLSTSLAAIAASREFEREQIESGVRPVRDERLTPAGHRRYLNQEIRRWGALIREAGVYAN